MLIFRLVLVAVALAAANARAQGLFLVDDTQVPTVTLSWPTTSGDPVEASAPFQYLSSTEKAPFTHNVDCFVCVGGTRIDAGYGHPKGAVIRVGLYKHDRDKLWFDDLPRGGVVSLKLEGVTFNQPAKVRIGTVLQHCQYSSDDVVACGLSANQIDLYNTASRTDTLGGKITPRNGRMGVLGVSSQWGESTALPAEDAGGVSGDVSFVQHDDGTIDLEARIPYALLRHVRDPWIRTDPGGFFEPYHYHVEFEALPVNVPDDPPPPEPVKMAPAGEE